MFKINSQIHLDSAPKFQVLNQLLQPQNKIKLTATDLEQLIPAAQDFDDDALKKLCNGFLTLIYDIAAKDRYYQAFGADAVNIAWEAFLSIVQHYKGNDYQRFPGMVKQLLHWRLNRMLQYEKGTISSFPEDIQEISDLDQIPDTNSSIENTLESTTITQALKHLGPTQQKAIIDYYYLGITPSEQARCNNKSIQAVYKNIRIGLKTLRKDLQDFYN